MENDNHEVLFEQVHNFNKRTLSVIAVALVISVVFVYSYLTQLHIGLVLTGMNVPTYWGVYIITFIFFIGIGHAGTLISALLRIMNAELFRPVTRLAEATTVFILMMGAAMIMMDVGRPVRTALYIPLFGRFQAQLLWDFVAISIYFFISVWFLYLAAIPDIAHLRDRVKNPKVRYIYEVLALNFRGTQGQWKRHNRLMLVLSVVVIPVVISVHTVISFIFSMTPQPLWHESIFGPYFVLGAIFSGWAFVLMTMFIVRWFYGLRRYLTDEVFDGMYKVLVAMAFIWLYFVIAESVTTFYGYEPELMAVLNARIFGKFQPIWVTMILLNFVLPFAVFLFRRTVKWQIIASVGVLIGMWLERFIIIIPTFANPILPLSEPRYLNPIMYIPTWVELGIFVGSFAVIFLFYYTFTKLIPIIPVSDVREEDEKGAKGIKETNPLYKYKEKRGQSSGVLLAQKGILGMFVMADITIIAIIVNGVRNGFIFGPMIESIRDISMWYSFGVSLYFLPILLIVLYSVAKFMIMMFKD